MIYGDDLMTVKFPRDSHNRHRSMPHKNPRRCDFTQNDNISSAVHYDHSWVISLWRGNFKKLAEKFTYRNGSRSKQKIKNKILLKEIEKIIRLINENKTVVLLAAVSLFITAAHKKKNWKPQKCWLSNKSLIINHYLFVRILDSPIIVSINKTSFAMIHKLK